MKDGENQDWWHFLTDLVPTSAIGAFTEGNIPPGQIRPSPSGIVVPPSLSATPA
ncbi:hypothetical protein OHA25_23630 [Nonomuraea sp. NBC_00507]|uniref:hypothetical protein n=1 Tax=Nonomuraea sp. NBC_00507 TaxID=2976002 RepID=UPI002E1937D1